MLRIYQLSDGYCYNSDSMFLYDFAMEFLRPKISLIDVGCGSGVVGLLCKRDFDVDLTMVEVEPLVAKIALKNSQKFGANVLNCDFLDYRGDMKFDVVISNPPFYRNGTLSSKIERVKIARLEDHLPFDDMVCAVKKIIKTNGSFIFCYDAKEAHRVFFVLRKYGFNAEVVRFVHPKEDSKASLLLCRARVNTKSSLSVLPPLFTHDNFGNLTPQVEQIYKLCATHSIKIHSSEILYEHLFC